MMIEILKNNSDIIFLSKDKLEKEVKKHLIDIAENYLGE